VHTDALLANHDGTDVGLGGKLGEGVERIGQEDFDPLALHDLSDDLTNLHVLVPRKIEVSATACGPHA
jgi:hypothetical protein